VSDARGAASCGAEAYAWECAENMRGWALRAEESNRELREQLDAARTAFEQIESEAEAFLADNLAPNMSMLRVRDRARFARAALGVEGEQEKPQ
jgi:hypothetical protein